MKCAVARCLLHLCDRHGDLRRHGVRGRRCAALRAGEPRERFNNPSSAEGVSRFKRQLVLRDDCR